MKKYVFLLAVVLLFASVAFANAKDLSVELTCPESIFSGDPLDVNAVISNYDCYDPVYTRKAIVALGGNSGGTLGALGLFGPYPRNFDIIMIPPAQCNQAGHAINPGRNRISLNIVSSVPASMEGTMVGVAVEIITPSGDTTGNSCMVEVIQ